MVSLTTTTQLFQGEDETQEGEREQQRISMHVFVSGCHNQENNVCCICSIHKTNDFQNIGKSGAEKEVAYRSCECVRVCRLHLEVIM